MKRTSIFGKFTLLIMMASIAVVVITYVNIAIYFHDMRARSPIINSFQRITKYFAAQIDVNDEDSTRKFLKAQGLNLRLISKDFEWSNSSEVPSLQTFREKSKGKSGYWYHNRYISMLEDKGNIYLFQGFSPFEHIEFPWAIALLWSGLVVIVFGLVHIKIHSLLTPLRILHKGVIRAGKGDFNIELPHTTTDEFGQLIRSFNDMALQVKNDIKSRDQLLRDISHEFRSPLSRMMVALEFLPEGNIRQTLKNNVLILEKMTSTILEEERIDSPYAKIKLEEVDLKMMLADISTSRNTSSQTVILLSNMPLKVLIDKDRFRMALSNIIDNAIKYSTCDSKPVEITYTKDDHHVTITVTDYGIGIPETDIPFIFEPFYRVDKARQHTSGGYGLGMSLTKKIIDAHKGEITIRSTLSQGTTVMVKINLIPDADG